MKHMYKFTVFLLAVLLLPAAAKAQDFIGLNQGSWGGVHTLHINPANVVASRYKVDINLVSANVNVGNNYASLSNDFIFRLSNPAVTDTMGEAYFRSNIFLDSTNGNPKNFLANATVLGPSFMFNITQKDAIAFTSRFRAQAMAEDVDEDLSNLIYNGVSTGDWGVPFSANYLSVRYNTWAEYGLSYGRVIYDNKEHFLTGGITLKFLQGLGSAYTTVKDYSLTFKNNDTIIQLSGAVSYGHSNNFVPGAPSPSFTLEAAGAGADIGFVYEYRPKWADWQYAHYKKRTCELKETGKRWEDPYMLKASIALINIGSIRYTKAPISRDYIANNLEVSTDLFNGVGSLFDISERLDSLEQASADFNTDPNNKTAYNLDMPLSLTLGFDYQILKGFYINANANIAFNQGSKDPHRLNNPHSVYVTPRYENPWFGAYMPLGYRQYSGFNWGLSLRLGPLVIGSADLFSNLIRGSMRGIDIYAGLKIPIPHQKPRDIDEDRVLDRFDLCKEKAGKCEFNGCPDRDNDGIQDSKDTCPDDPGLAEFNGCPDTDGDGIPDKDDKCPTDAGSKELQGCPDRDFDGVIDREDECPDEKGLAEFNGCPDMDADGVPDRLDQCPTLPGPKSQFGCPDTDGDGVYDNVDACPTEKGLVELMGCPYTDTDKDGIKDTEDKCPEQPGPIENGGCPYADTDADGIIDLEDKCPQTPGVKENFGCPPIAPEEQEVLKRAFDNLEFNTGKSTIRSSSYESLNELAELLKTKPDYKLLIEGHTDNVGKRTTNMTLSKNRANAVKNYLVKKGVDSSRFVVNWYGPDKPIDTNETDEGRQRNRRVEMTVIFD